MPSRLGVHLYPGHTQRSADDRRQIHHRRRHQLRLPLQRQHLSINDDVTMVRGKHQFVFGGEFVRNQLNISNAYESNGIFTFNGDYSGSGPNGGHDRSATRTSTSSGARCLPSSRASSSRTPCARPSPASMSRTPSTPPAADRRRRRPLEPEFMPYDDFNRGTIFNKPAFLANRSSTVYPNAPAGTSSMATRAIPAPSQRTRPGSSHPIRLIVRSHRQRQDRDPRRLRTRLRSGELLHRPAHAAEPALRHRHQPDQTSTSGPISFAAPWSVGPVTTKPLPATPQFPPRRRRSSSRNRSTSFCPRSSTPSYTGSGPPACSISSPTAGRCSSTTSATTPCTSTRHPLSPALYIPGIWGAGGTGCTHRRHGPAGKTRRCRHTLLHNHQSGLAFRASPSPTPPRAINTSVAVAARPRRQ